MICNGPYWSSQQVTLTKLSAGTHMFVCWINKLNWKTKIIFLFVPSIALAVCLAFASSCSSLYFWLTLHSYLMVWRWKKNYDLLSRMYDVILLWILRNCRGFHEKRKKKSKKNFKLSMVEKILWIYGIEIWTHNSFGFCKFRNLYLKLLIYLLTKITWLIF